MDKQRILAARKKLKEFQRSMQKQNQEPSIEDFDPKKFKNIRKASLESTGSHHSEVQHSLPNMDAKENNGSTSSEIRSTNESPNLSNIGNHINNFPSSVPNVPDSASVQNVYSVNEATNGSTEASAYSNFTPDYSRHENNFGMPPQGTQENVDQTNYFQHFSQQQQQQQQPQQQQQQFEIPNLPTQTPNHSSGSLQKEHLLQMANAVANVLVDDKGLDESTLNNCDLEQRNQFLTCCLEEQKKLVNELHIQVSQSNSRISELEAIIATKSSEYENRLFREINPLKEQIQLDAQTIGILVGEKEELSATNAQAQAVIKQKTDEVADLYGKLKNALQRGTDLEREIVSLKNSAEEYVKSFQELQKNYNELMENSAKLKKENEDYELEISELRQKLNFKNTEIAGLQQELQEKVALLSLSEIRMQQLTTSPQEGNSLETQHHTTKALEQQLSQMKAALDSVSGEKDEVSKKYQSYMQQLDDRYTKLLAEFEASKKVITESEIREQSYIQRLSELEQQLQREKAKSVKPTEDQSEKIEMLTKGMDNLVLEQENLQSLINEKDNEIEELKKELRELQDIKEQSVEASKLVTALQSEQLGASRAVSQNQQLKTQLDEMHDAFIALSNTKLDLTEQLQAERTIGKKLNAQLNEVEKKVDELKEELAQKEAALVQLEKEKLQAAQIEDQIQHYQAQSHSATTLQQELQKALMTIETLKKENQMLNDKLGAIQEDNKKTVEKLQEDVERKTETEYVMEKTLTEQVDGTDAKENNTEIPKAQSVIAPVNDIPVITEPIKKLEARFKETMEKVAELTDEKQRLEHLVLQLQGETETIGEYVTLYQKQRAILQEKAKEKEQTFRLVLEQRNQQQEQLHKLKVLVADLLKSRNVNSNVATATVAEENMPLSEQPNESNSDSIEVIDGHVNKTEEAINPTDRTASQIMDLLSEIKDCNNSCMFENFHPCPWCSGKLITV